MSRRLAWTPREVRLLREVQNLSQRAFAQRLGYAQSTVVGWERPNRVATLQHETVEVLTVELGRLPRDQRDVFDRECGLASGSLGGGSAARTTTLLDSGHYDSDVVPPYLPDDRVVESFRLFLASPARVFLMSGPAGVGKSTLSRHLSRRFADDMDVQLLAVNSWEMTVFDLAVEVLRYASIPRGDDALLTLEAHCARLTKPCVVIIDGIASQDAFAAVGRHVDAILRQVTSTALRFLLVVRTPPTIETTVHPLLHASLYTPESPRGDLQQTVSSWSSSDTRAVWEQNAATPYGNLPAGVRHLIRTPLYMKLALGAAPPTAGDVVGSYALLDHCVRRILGGLDDARHLDLLADLAYHQAYADLPAVLQDPLRAPAIPVLPAELPATLVRASLHDHGAFTHDVLREFFLGTRLAEVIHRHGRSVTTVRALNDLAGQATTSSAARSVFDLVIQRLDALDPALLEFAVTAPTVSLNTTVPLILTMARDARFLTPEVLRACAARAETGDDPAVCRALLPITRLYDALGPHRYRWLLVVLQRFGPVSWDGVAAFVEETFDSADAYTLLDQADLTNGEQATFFARHFYLFFADSAHSTLELFLSHVNWRVRAALAEALRADSAPLDATAAAILARLVRDPDYKVRAAAALTLARAPQPAATEHLTTLLNDDNWHVRDRALHGLEQSALRPIRQNMIRCALTILATESSWAHPPRHIRPTADRLRLLYDPAPADTSDSTVAAAGDQRALITILREIRTRHLAPPQQTRDALLEHGLHSDHWLVRREAEHLAAEDTGAGADPRVAQERYRRLRGSRTVQVALDMHDITDAVRVAQAAAAAGADLIEIGDPLIKAAGLRAIEQVKTAVDDTPVVAEMMSADWGRDQVVLAAQAGADIVQLIGPATAASVRAAVDAGRRLAVPVLLDTPTHRSNRWVSEMENAGIDGLTITTNIDNGIGSGTPLDAARELRAWTKLPVAVSGGFSTADSPVFASPDWDILIVGRSVVDALDPTTAARNLIDLIRHTERHR